MAVKTFQVLVQQVVAVSIDEDRYARQPFDWSIFGRSRHVPETVEEHAQALALHQTQGLIYIDHGGPICLGYGELGPRGITLKAQPISSELLGD